MKKDKKIGALRGFALSLLLLLLLLVNLLAGCGGAEDFPEKYLLGKFSGFDGESKTEAAQLLTLVNPWTPMEEGYVPPLDSLSDGTRIDARMREDLRAMLEVCREAGCAPYICSAYRSMEEQTELFENKVARVMAEGHDRVEAEAIAAREVARPGTSEHQLGLALDIIDGGYGALDEAQAETAAQRWLMENSWRYGFILRYPEGKSELTGIIYEPWHYRYVGREAAEAIYESGLCLEEWLEQRETLQAVENAVNAQVEALRRRAFVMLWNRK